ncbi:CutA1 divalent ion tolerance protein [Aphelenchoides avenae]|nr:CutA1 divalent ion tolerance protein [Aphelenchus avenae]
MSLFSVVQVTAPSMEVGQQIAREIVGKKLAACVNIVPQVKSIYSWKGNIEEDSEVLMIIKTKTERVDDLKRTVLQNHPYDVPEFISLPIQTGSEAYLKWLGEQVDDKDQTTSG